MNQGLKDKACTGRTTAACYVSTAATAVVVGDYYRRVVHSALTLLLADFPIINNNSKM